MRSGWTGGGALAIMDEGENLALAVHQRQEGAFERLVEQFERSLFNYVNRLLQSPQDAQEVVQDAFLRAHDALTRRYDGVRAAELALKPWLFRIARNLSFNRRRGSKSRVDEPLTAFDDGRIGPLVPEGSVSSGLEKEQERAALDRAIAALPPDARELIVLRFMEEMPYAEMARCTGLNESALRGRVFRSLKLLREALSREEVTHAV
ncbi:MAG TPA: RNA polymerase sigma factor [Thermoanaerobaculia bacterium]|nr:RNA polymerase sigma factor [Thermoanaerobaculia bacterium]